MLVDFVLCFCDEVGFLFGVEWFLGFVVGCNEDVVEVYEGFLDVM